MNPFCYHVSMKRFHLLAIAVFSLASLASAKGYVFGRYILGERIDGRAPKGFGEMRTGDCFTLSETNAACIGHRLTYWTEMDVLTPDARFPSDLRAIKLFGLSFAINAKCSVASGEVFEMSLVSDHHGDATPDFMAEWRNCSSNLVQVLSRKYGRFALADREGARAFFWRTDGHTIQMVATASTNNVGVQIQQLHLVYTDEDALERAVKESAEYRGDQGFQRDELQKAMDLL